jgi:tetratricopeptide (TPR) repeat protein
MVYDIELEVGEYKKAIDIAPNDFKALVNLAIAYSQSGLHESAIGTWKRVIELKPDSVEAYTSPTVDYERLGVAGSLVALSRDGAQQRSGRR